VHTVALPTGTIRVQPDSICASVRGLLFQPCFAIHQTDAKSFRGSISGLGFAYCDFTRRNPRLEASASAAPAPSATPPQPQQASPAVDALLRASISP